MKSNIMCGVVAVVCGYMLIIVLAYRIHFPELTETQLLLKFPKICKALVTWEFEK